MNFKKQELCYNCQVLCLSNVSNVFQMFSPQRILLLQHENAVDFFEFYLRLTKCQI